MESEKIKNAILTFNQPFNKTDLFYYMKHVHGIENHKLICEVLDDLCESEIIKYVEIEDNCWAFVILENISKNRKICEAVASDIPSEIEINSIGRSVVMIKSGRLYPVTHSVLKSLTQAIVDSASEVKIKTNGLTITQVDKIANVIRANENATVEVTLPKYTRVNQAMLGEIRIK